MQDIYEPPFHMTEEITNPIVEIGEYVGSISALDSLRRNPVLRRENRIKTIYSSLAIEQNTLSLDQVSDVIEGKRCLDRPGIYGKSKMLMKHMSICQRKIRMTQITFCTLINF